MIHVHVITKSDEMRKSIKTTNGILILKAPQYKANSGLYKYKFPIAFQNFKYIQCV